MIDDRAFDFARLRVLCADANANMRRIYRSLLLGIGCADAAVVDDGAAAYQQFISSTFDILITDIDLPSVTGLELIERIRKRSDQSRFTPVIVCTSEATIQSIKEARDLGATEFLAKPISAQKLRERIVGVVTRPRPFVETKTFFGPDRRRARAQGNGGGKGVNASHRRRADDVAAAIAGQTENPGEATP
ncbi:response regulator [Terrarubrum flagellatum]|uniref:response regulator n=1 Tax=Terrirubrum flagellatum TaxID=2895980 RepID=UPI003145697B